MASQSGHKYAQAEADVPERSTKLATDSARKYVRGIKHYAVLTPEWVGLTGGLKQLAGSVEFESKAPANLKLSEAHGRDKDSSGTLWDQEVSENAIRILVEEAKLNLCLRMMNEFKVWQKTADFEKLAADISKGTMVCSPAALQVKSVEFEEAMGFLLCRSLLHKEVLQLMDVPLLLEHIAMVLTGARERMGKETDWKPGPRKQEMLVIQYFSSLMKHAEELNNGEVLAKAREIKLVQLMTDHVIMFCATRPLEVIFVAVDGFAALADNEDFGSSWQGFLPDEPSQTAFLKLQEILLTPVLAGAPERKKELRPLMDLFATVKRCCAK